MDRDGFGLRAELRDYYQSLVKKTLSGHDDKSLYGFAPLIGSKYFFENFRLLVCGRAVDGWRKKWRAKRQGSISAQEIVENNIFFLPEEDRTCEMNWLIRAQKTWAKNERDCQGVRKGYNFHRSSFWSATRDLVQLMNKESPHVKHEWPGTLAWSNVYKISPERGNPDHRLRKLQIENCIQILNAEISYLQPTHILFITGSWGKKVIQSLGIHTCLREDDFKRNSIIRHSGTLGDSRVVIASRPEGKKRKLWVKAVAEAFDASGSV